MKKNQANYKREVVDVISKIARQNSDSGLLVDFMADILTPHEFENISVRWQIVKKLAKYERHEDIASNLSVGIATVTRGSREMRDQNGGFHKALRFLNGNK